MYASADRSELAHTGDETYRPSLALCIIEALQSAATTAADAAYVLDRYDAYRAARGQWAGADGVRALLETFEEVGSCDQWEGKVGNYRRRYSPTSAPVAASAIVHAAELFYTHHIDSVADLRLAIRSHETSAALETGLRAISTQPDMWFEFLHLTGLDRGLALVSA